MIKSFTGSFATSSLVFTFADLVRITLSFAEATRSCNPEDAGYTHIGHGLQREMFRRAI